MSGTLPMTTQNISDDEARMRLEELDIISVLAHAYSRVKRATEHDDGSAETDGDHVVHLGLLTIAYATKYRPDLDPGKLALYILLHDIDEAIYGDVSTLGADEAALQKKYAQEAKAREVIRSRLASFPALLEILEDIDTHTLPEYRFAKAFDKIAPGFTHALNHGSALAKHNIGSYEDIIAGTAATDERMRQYAYDYPDVLAMRRLSHVRVAESSFKNAA